MLGQGCGADEFIFHGMLGACEGDGQWPRAIALLKLMPKHQLQPSAQGYNAAIGVCSKGHEWERELVSTVALCVSPAPASSAGEEPPVPRTGTNATWVSTPATTRQPVSIPQEVMIAPVTLVSLAMVLGSA